MTKVSLRCRCRSVCSFFSSVIGPFCPWAQDQCQVPGCCRVNVRWLSGAVRAKLLAGLHMAGMLTRYHDEYEAHGQHTFVR